MSQIVFCPKCSARVAVRTEQQGRRVKCPSCQKPFSTPAALDGSPDSHPNEVDWLSLEVPAESSTQIEKSHSSNQDGQQFRIRCPVCESILYVNRNQVGQTIRCSDCEGRVRVPNPPKKLATPPSANGPASPCSDDAPKVQNRENSRKEVDDVLKSAEEAAEHQASEKEKRAVRFDGWTKPVLRAFADPGVILHLVVLAIVIAFPVGITVFNRKYGFATFPFMAIGSSLVMTCGLAIVQTMANGQKTVEEWPTIDLWSWFESSLVVGSALICSVTPALFLATLISPNTMVTVSLMLFGAHLLFPFFVLSILDTQSIFVPVSLDVIRSWQHSGKDSWIFYFAAGAALSLGPVYFAIVPVTPVTAGIGAAVCVVVAFVYAALLGRLAFALGEDQREVSMKADANPS